MNRRDWGYVRDVALGIVICIAVMVGGCWAL